MRLLVVLGYMCKALNKQDSCCIVWYFVKLTIGVTFISSNTNFDEK